jgi:signal transduction histidine kinase
LILTNEKHLLIWPLVTLDPQKAEGYGLGLSIFKKITEKLGGSAGVESKGNGDGSKFYFILPSVQNNANYSVNKVLQ